jgi:hypothetical protein
MRFIHFSLLFSAWMRDEGSPPHPGGLPPDYVKWEEKKLKIFSLPISHNLVEKGFILILF